MSLPLDQQRVVLLGADGFSTRAVYHALKKEFSDVQVILEDRLPRTQLVRRRIKKLGLPTVIGQILFMSLLVPLLTRTGARRIDAIKRQYGLNGSEITDDVHQVPSVNSEEARQVLQRLRPSVVVVNGTRIIGRETLSAVDAPFINTHVGITPLYRGVHGGYWALSEGNPDLAGTTVHFVDEGIDTGTIIEQTSLDLSSEDSFATYPFLHTAAGLPILMKAVRASLTGTPPSGGAAPSLPSKLRSHPTLWGYLYRRTFKGVR
jgi:folate-dependent phosphoribosylglycinamide formyltransferase PurN